MRVEILTECLVFCLCKFKLAALCKQMAVRPGGLDGPEGYTFTDLILLAPHTRHIDINDRFYRLSVTDYCVSSSSKH